MSYMSATEKLGVPRFAAILSVYSRLPGTAIVTVVNAALIVIVVSEGGRPGDALYWLGAVALVSAVRLATFFGFRRDIRQEKHSRRWAALSFIGSLCSGVLWGLGPILPLGEFYQYQWLWAFAIGGMCAGAASLNAAHLPTALAFIVPAALPLALSLMAQGTLEGAAASIMTLAFIALTGFNALLFSDEFGRSLEFKGALEARAAELDTANRRLSEEIEDHRTTSEALHQAQKMDALGNLTGGFAHDFNNILTVVIGNLDIIANARHPDKVREMARSATAAAESGAELVSRLLAFARKQTLAPRIVNVVDVVVDFRELLTHALSGSTRVEFDLLGPIAVANIDTAQFQAMLLNLVVNARDAMPQGGTITLSVSKSVLDAQAVQGMDVPPGEFVTIAVADEGEGMSPETLKRAFEPFYTTKIGRGGTGLGLSQVYGLAQQSGGFVKIDSTLGKGTCVTVFIPAIDDKALVEDDAKQSVAIVVPTCSVLLVDDNAAVLKALEAGLAEEGWTTAIATDGPSALGILERGTTFDIVVTDIDLPGAINGHALAAMLCERHPMLPILLISGAPLPEDCPMGHLPFLSKPFRKQSLIEKVHAVIRERRGTESV